MVHAMMERLGIGACVHIYQGKSCESFEPVSDKEKGLVDRHATKFLDGDTAKATVEVCEQVARIVGYNNYPQPPEGVAAGAHCRRLLLGKSKGGVAFVAYMKEGIKDEL